MNVAGKKKFCVNCGEPLSGDVKFCVNCGAPRDAGPVHADEPVVSDVAPPSSASGAAQPVSADETATTVDLPEVIAPEPPRRAVPSVLVAGEDEPLTSPSSRKPRMLIAAAIALVVIIGIVAGVAFAASGHKSHARVTTLPTFAIPTTSNVFSATIPDTEAETVPDTEADTPTTVADALGAAVSQMNSELQASSTQVTQLKSIIAQFDPSTTGQSNKPCGLSAADAASQTGTIITSREQIVSDLTDSASSDDRRVLGLVRALRNAITLSLQSDYDYQGWMTANANTDGTNPCARTHDANWTASQDLAPRAGDAKKTFLAAYNPVAAQYGLRSDWTYTDF